MSLHLSFLCPCVPIEVDMKGGVGSSHVPYSGKDNRSPLLAAVSPTGSINDFIVSYGPLAKYTEKNYLLFYSVILLLPEGHP